MFDASTAHQSRFNEHNPHWGLCTKVYGLGTNTLTMMVNVKTGSNQAKQKAIVGIVVGLVKKQKQESPKTLGLQRVV